MNKCEVCGNEYDKTFEVNMGGLSHIFDSFECAVQKLAPKCFHCHSHIMGHGVEAGEKYFCSAHCARVMGETGFVDRHFTVQNIASAAP